MRPHPELNATNPSERFTGRCTFTFRRAPGFDLVYLLATDLVATTALGDFLDASSEETVLREPRPDAGALEELYAFDALPNLDALAAAQGITPVTDFEDLLGDSWPEGESVEDFIAAATEGRYGQETPSP